MVAAPNLLFVVGAGATIAGGIASIAAVAASLLLCLICPLTVFLYLKFHFGKLKGRFQNLSILSRDEVVVAGVCTRLADAVPGVLLRAVLVLDPAAFGIVGTFDAGRSFGAVLAMALLPTGRGIAAALRVFVGGSAPARVIVVSAPLARDVAVISIPVRTALIASDEASLTCVLQEAALLVDFVVVDLLQLMAQ